MDNKAYLIEYWNNNKRGKVTTIKKGYRTAAAALVAAKNRRARGNDNIRLEFMELIRIDRDGSAHNWITWQFWHR